MFNVIYQLETLIRADSGTATFLQKVSAPLIIQLDREPNTGGGKTPGGKPFHSLTTCTVHWRRKGKAGEYEQAK